MHTHPKKFTKWASEPLLPSFPASLPSLKHVPSTLQISRNLVRDVYGEGSDSFYFKGLIGSLQRGSNTCLLRILNSAEDFAKCVDLQAVAAYAKGMGPSNSLLPGVNDN